MDPIQDKFFNVTDHAVALNLELQLKFDDQRRYIAPAHWLQDFGTVDVNVGRGVGKTLYITKRMRPCDLVIVATEEDVKQYCRMNEEKLENVVSAGSISSKIGLTDYWRGRKFPNEFYNKVYVDEPGRVLSGRDSRYEFYNWFGNKCNQLIMLGTAVRA